MATPQTFATPAPQMSQVIPGLLTSATSAQRAPLAPDETMYGNMLKITKSNDPWMQAAETAAKQQMGAKGLLNSSMAVGAAQQAAYQAAAPVAQFDANANKSVGDMQFNADQQTNQNNATAANSMSTFNAETTNKATLANMDTAAKTALADKDTTTKMALADIEANYRTLMQADDQAVKMYQAAVNNITDINNSSTMDGAAKTAAIAAQKQMLQAGFRTVEAMNNLRGLDELLTF